MKNNLHPTTIEKNGQINFLKGKEKFIVSDLIKILNLLDENAEVRFGVLGDDLSFKQEEIFVFSIKYDSKLKDDYIFNIITINKSESINSNTSV